MCNMNYAKQRELYGYFQIHHIFSICLYHMWTLLRGMVTTLKFQMIKGTEQLMMWWHKLQKEAHKNHNLHIYQMERRT
jgi:hypothetical protein